MELINNLFQFAVTLLGFCLSGIWYLKDRKQTCFLLTCFDGCFALGSLYWTLYLLLFSETPQVFYVSEFGWIASVIFLYLLQYTLSSAEERDFSTRKALIAPLDRRSAVRVLLHLWGYPLQSALVRYDDRCFLSFHPRACLCPDADGNGSVICDIFILGCCAMWR
ncbi:MAG: hypothetical protein ACLUTA_16845 [Blautia wexlerae]